MWQNKQYINFNTEVKKATMMMLIGLTSHLHTFVDELNRAWSSSNTTTRTDESIEKDFKSKTSSSPRTSISSSYVSFFFSLNLYQLDSHSALSFFRISQSSLSSNTMFNPTLPCIKFSYVTVLLAPPRRLLSQWSVLVVSLMTLPLSWTSCAVLHESPKKDKILVSVLLSAKTCCEWDFSGYSKWAKMV